MTTKKIWQLAYRESRRGLTSSPTPEIARACYDASNVGVHIDKWWVMARAHEALMLRRGREHGWCFDPLAYEMGSDRRRVEFQAIANCEPYWLP